MKAIGIVAEYNPFHEGHGYLIRESRKALGAQVCVSVMSGMFCQRGFPCVEDKWTRTEAALQGGVDLVVELPVVYATGSAELFAKGAVSILEGFGSIEHLVFGSESGDLPRLQQTARFLREHEEEINERAAALQKEGVSFPKAREHACSVMDPSLDASLIREPNNILALEYLKSLDAMQPFTVKRSDEGYHETGTALRMALAEAEPDRFRSMESRYFDLLRYAVLRGSGQQLARISGASGGLGEKLRKELPYAQDLEELIRRVKSKGYTRTRISRYLTHVLLGIQSELEASAPTYIRVLGFNARGAAFLKECRRLERMRIPVLTNLKPAMERSVQFGPLLEKDLLATQVYGLITGGDLYRDHDYVRKPVVMQENH